MGWMVTQDIRNDGTGEERNFRFSEWGPDAALEMCNKVRDLPSPYGGVIGDIFDQTPKERISKVMLEDKVGSVITRNQADFKPLFNRISIMTRVL